MVNQSYRLIQNLTHEKMKIEFIFKHAPSIVGTNMFDKDEEGA